MRAALFGFLGGLAALVLVGAVAGVALWRYQSAAPARERAALVADLDAYQAWYDANAHRRNLGDAYYLPYRDTFIRQHPRLEQYILWWRDERRALPNGGSVWALATTDALLPADLRDPAMLDKYLAR